MTYAYYNENEPYAAAWLRNLMKAGLIPDGVVDDRGIADVQSEDLRGFRQCHFFAGIAGWSLALQMAGWPEDREVWTGSCPCQPFSSAGKQLGFYDPRHLWPVWHRLIRERRPATVFGEQVARAPDWLRLVRSDLEALAYAMGAMPIEAAGVGAPHKRDRYWFVADANGAELRDEPRRRSGACGQGSALAREHGAARLVADALDVRLPHGEGRGVQTGPRRGETLGYRSGGKGGRDFWRAEPAVGRVAHGLPARVGRLRAYGNAIVPQAGAVFIEAFLECRP